MEVFVEQPLALPGSAKKKLYLYAKYPSLSSWPIYVPSKCNFFQGVSLALRSTGQFNVSHWSTYPPWVGVLDLNRGLSLCGALKTRRSPRSVSDWPCVEAYKRELFQIGPKFICLVFFDAKLLFAHLEKVSVSWMQDVLVTYLLFVHKSIFWRLLREKKSGFTHICFIFYNGQIHGSGRIFWLTVCAGEKVWNF